MYKWNGTRPKGSLGALDGSFYKIGANELPFYWNNVEWIKSQKSKDEVLLALSLKRDRWLLPV